MRFYPRVDPIDACELRDRAIDKSPPLDSRAHGGAYRMQGGASRPGRRRRATAEVQWPFVRLIADRAMPSGLRCFFLGVSSLREKGLFSFQASNRILHLRWSTETLAVSVGKSPRIGKMCQTSASEMVWGVASSGRRGCQHMQPACSPPFPPPRRMRLTCTRVAGAAASVRRRAGGTARGRGTSPPAEAAEAGRALMNAAQVLERVVGPCAAGANWERDCLRVSNRYGDG